MTIPMTTHKKADILSIVLLIAGFFILTYVGNWWPHIILPITASILLRQYLRGRIYDLILTLIVFGGMYLFYLYPFNWAVLMPVIFVCGALTILFREFFIHKQRVGKEEMEDARLEIDDEQHERES